jgi:glycosyltransferase involved in cell wall biosynthesis
LDAVAQATNSIDLVVAGGAHPRLEGHDSYAEDLRRRYGHVADFVGYVRPEEVEGYFKSADLLLLPYPVPFATSGPLALALGFGTPVLCSEALGNCVGAPPEMVAPGGSAGWAKRLVHLSSNPQEFARLDALTAEFASGRSWSQVARRHVEIYEEVIYASRTPDGRLWPGQPGR